MSVYESGVEAYRSTAKWLVSLVPAATIVAAGIALGPDLVDQAAKLTLQDFIARHWPTLFGAVLIAVGNGVVVWQCADLLSKRAPDVSRLDTTVTDEAFAAGVAIPYFVDRFTYEEAQNQLTAWIDSRVDNGDEQSTAAQPDSEMIKALGSAVDELRHWALHRDIASGFASFRRWFAGGLVAMIVGLLIAAVDLTTPSTERRDPPVAVLAELTDVAWNDMATALSCDIGVTSQRPAVELWLVAGEWNEPVLQVDGAGCEPSTDWTPSMPVAVRPVPATP